MSSELFVAADGMPVRVLPTPGDAFMGAAIGYLAPGTRYAVHFHYSLEQLTFVVRGTVEVTMANAKGVPLTRTLGAGEAIANPPATTLDFRNPGADEAEVLFVCAPPFPVDGADVALAGSHRLLTSAEQKLAGARSAQALEQFRRVIELRRGSGISFPSGQA
ncbi:MAG: cupin domain-containing protein [Chloroflexota bacterium]|nr:MAG: cupin domain-containing protein [Chloroflexota bacterium]